MGQKCSFIATGDAFITRRLPKQGYNGFSEIQKLIASHDVRFNNLETTIHQQEGYPSAFSGGTWAMSDPLVLDDLNGFTFNVYNTANNHSMDYGYGGLLATIRNIRERNIVYAGTGANLYEASKPAYLETPEARVAIVAACSTFNPAAIAGNQSRSMRGRPGLNPLRYKRVISVEKKYFESLKKIAIETNINASYELSVRNCFAKPMESGLIRFGELVFKEDYRNIIHTIPDSKDMDRILSSIKEGKTQADYVLVSMHSHEFSGESIQNPAEFYVSFCKACIDEGADAIIGHGPHEVRGIEIYKGKPIFYSLGNFIFQSDTVELQPADAYENAGLSSDLAVGAYMDNRSCNESAGFVIQPNIWSSVIASFLAEDGDIREIKLYPISLDMAAPRSRRGWPSLTDDESQLWHIAELSKPFGTEIDINGGVGIIKL